MKIATTYLVLIAILFIISGISFVLSPFIKRCRGEYQTTPSPIAIKPNKPKYVRGIHLTSWVAGSKNRRKEILKLLDETELNTVVIAVKECHGEVCIPGVKLAEELNAYKPVITDIKEFLTELKNRKIYTIARIVVFSDNIAARKKPQWAVKSIDGNIWTSYKSIAWLDPYVSEAREYNLSIAERCIELGFEEIQFDYVRFPSDGETWKCRYSQPHSSVTAVDAINKFLSEAKEHLKIKRGANISVDIFGLTTSVEHDMGIGQSIIEITKLVDFICPMVYPSHYRKGEYGLSDPNRQPYKTVDRSLKDAIKRLGDESAKLRPYLQDFSLGYKYGPKEVLAQIQACYDNDIPEWTLWDPNCVYTHSALKPEEFSDKYEKSIIKISTETIKESSTNIYIPKP